MPLPVPWGKVNWLSPRGWTVESRLTFSYSHHQVNHAYSGVLDQLDNEGILLQWKTINSASVHV